jgi:hypothetical protein
MRSPQSCALAVTCPRKQQGYFVGHNSVRDTAVAPTEREPQQTCAYNLEEIRTILSVLPEPAATIFAVAALTGLRRLSKLQSFLSKRLRNPCIDEVDGVG